MIRFTRMALLAVAGSALGLGIQQAGAQTCTEPAGSLFTTETLVAPGGTLGETSSGNYGSVGMSIAADGRIFIAKMQSGEIRVYKPGTTTTVLADSIPNYTDTEDGLLGVVLDPGFMTNRWLYTLASDPCGLNCANRAHELARFTYDSTQAPGSQLTSKKVILRFPRATNNPHHAAGNMDFDKNGVLVIGTGDNTDPHNSNNNGFGPIYYPTNAADAQRTSANTNDLRGKILRIKPVAFADNQTPAAGEGTTYTIPAGNLWEKINNLAFNPGWKNDSDDITKVRKEIFSMGHRNPFHPRVDTRTGWIFWGEIGPDQGTQALTGRGPTGHDEWNLAYTAANFGHPYCNGYNVPYASLTAPSTTYGALYDCNANDPSRVPLINKSPNNTGIYHLPKSTTALVAYASGNSTDDDVRFGSTYSTTTLSHGSESAIGGPMYRYDTASTTAGRFPAYYEGKIIFFDWARRNLRWITLDSNGTIPAGAAGVTNFAPTGWTTASYLDMQFGPDGMLYALRNTGNNYNTDDGGLYRVSYTGTHDNACFKRFRANNALLGPGATQNGPVSIRQTIRRAVAPSASVVDGMVTLPVGYRAIALYDLSGRMVWSHVRAAADHSEVVRIPGNLADGILQARLTP
jgi:cytochrome c